MPREYRALVLVPLLLAAIPLMATGCPGRLENPERFVDGGPFECPDVVKELFPQRCGGSICHEGAMPAAGLDLVKPGVVDRLVNKQAAYCKGILADPMDPEGSLLYLKMSPGPPCGSPMPLGGEPLTEAELGCVRDWIGEQMGAVGDAGGD